MSVAGSEERTALVLYGSETGNAQDVAEELGRLAQRLHCSSLVSSLDAVEPEQWHQYSLVIIAISTTGQGEFPANSKSMWKSVCRKKLPSDYLASVKFALFGLGDSSYPKFNWAALLLYRRLINLGAVPIIDKGEGDEQHPEGADSIFLPWAQTLREKIVTTYPLSDGLEPMKEDALLQPQWLLGNAQPHSLTSGNGLSSDERSSKTGHEGLPLDVTLTANDRVTAKDHWQDVRLLKFKAAESVKYVPGDILTIYPENTTEDVDHLLHLLGWEEQADKPIAFERNQEFAGALTTPEPIFKATEKGDRLTLRYLLTNCLDLNAIPRRSFFSLIMHFTSDEFQKTRLQEFADPEYTDELFDYTTRPRRSILEVLQEFDTLKVPWQWAASVLPALRGRQFSIASGGQLKSDSDSLTRFELLVAIVKYKTVIRKIRRGTCTRYLEGLPVGSKLRVALVKGSLGIDIAQAERPMIMIGPGTGVAPMRSLIWERLSWQNGLSSLASPTNGQNGTTRRMIGNNLLFFGCRGQESDYFFKDEWTDLQGDMPLQVLPAFSRDQSRKVYVQDLIREHQDKVFHLVHDLQGTIYVCGSSGKMPQAVREALIDCFQKGLSSDREKAEAYLKDLEKEKKGKPARYKQETW